MCSEAVWWRCRRRIVSDYLIGAGESVSTSWAQDAGSQKHLTASAIVQASGAILYLEQSRLPDRSQSNFGVIGRRSALSRRTKTSFTKMRAAPPAR